MLRILKVTVVLLFFIVSYSFATSPKDVLLSPALKSNRELCFFPKMPLLTVENVNACKQNSLLIDADPACNTLDCKRIATCYASLGIKLEAVLSSFTLAVLRGELDGLEQDYQQKSKACQQKENSVIGGVPIQAVFTNWTAVPSFTKDNRERRASRLARDGKQLEAAELFEALFSEFKNGMHAFYAAELYEGLNDLDKAANLYKEYYIASPGTAKRIGVYRVINILRSHNMADGWSAGFADELFNKKAYYDAAQFYMRENSIDSLIKASNSFLLSGMPLDSLMVLQRLAELEAPSDAQKQEIKRIKNRADTLSVPVTESNKLILNNRYIQAANVLTSDPNTKKVPVFICTAGLLLDQPDRDVLRAKALYEECLKAEPDIFDSAFFHARASNQILTGGPEALAVDEPYVWWNGASVSSGDCGSFLNCKDDDTGYELALTAKAPPGYMFTGQYALTQAANSGNTYHEEVFSKSKRNFFARLRATRTGCSCAAGFPFGDGNSKLALDFKIFIAPMDGPATPAPDESNPFTTHEIVKGDSVGKAFPPSGSCPEAPPSPSNCTLRALSDIQVKIFTESVCGTKGKVIEPVIFLRRNETKTVNSPNNRIRFDYRVSDKDSFHGDVGAWCSQNSISVP